LGVAPQRGIAALLLFVVAGCGRNVKTIPPVLEGISLLGDTLWSVPVPIQGGRERVTRLQEARERLNHTPGNFQAAYDVARYTADLGRFSQAIELYGAAASMGGLDPRPYARRGELYLLLRRIDRATSDLRTADRLNTGGPLSDQQITPGGEMLPRNYQNVIPSQLGIASLVRGEGTRAAEYFKQSSSYVESLREAIQATLWFRASQPGSDFPATLPARFRSAINAMVRNATGGVGTGGCPAVTGNLVDGDLVCFVHGSRLLADGRREEALTAFDIIRRRSHWSTPAHLVAEAALARLQGESDVITKEGTRKGSPGRRAFR
jgi:tetratricopeptide (TPR) repeat protein